MTFELCAHLPQCWELVLKALTDPSQLVVSAAYSYLLPALAAWALELNILETEVISYFLHQLLTCIKVGWPFLLPPSIPFLLPCSNSCMLVFSVQTSLPSLFLNTPTNKNNYKD